MLKKETDELLRRRENFEGERDQKVLAIAICCTL